MIAMIEYGSTIRLQHEYAMRFFEEAMNPDMEELRQRDAFFAKLEQECPARIENGDLIAEILDIDIERMIDHARDTFSRFPQAGRRPEYCDY